MICRFTKERQKHFKHQMIVWSIGLFVIVPLSIIIFPYLIGMPLEKWGSSPIHIMIEGRGALEIFTIWIIGVICSLLAHVFNPIREDEVPPKKNLEND